MDIKTIKEPEPDFLSFNKAPVCFAIQVWKGAFATLAKKAPVRFVLFPGIQYTDILFTGFLKIDPTPSLALIQLLIR